VRAAATEPDDDGGVSAAAPVRLSELVATLSLVSDLGMGRPMERVLRQTVIAMRLAGLGAVDDEVRAAVYYTSLLTWVGCAADTSDLAGLFGDETELFAETHDDDLAGLTLALFMARRLGRGDSPVRRLGLVGRFVLSAGRSVRGVMQSHCQASGELAARLGLGEAVRLPLLQAFERWDGRGVPGLVGAVALAPAIRLVHVADTIEAFHHTGGAAAARAVVRQRRGTQFDPALVDLFDAHHGKVLAGLDEVEAWDEVIALEPSLGEPLSDERLDRALEALADFADLKSPHRLGHSRGVASLAGGAAAALGLGAADAELARRAGLVHDLGMIGVPSGVWDETRRWSLAQRERARTHPYLTERMLARPPALAAIGHCASLHHERLDGSGYPRGLRGEAIPVPARLLAAADVYHALREPRPHRDALAGDDAVRVVRDEVRAGRLDGEAVNAVLAAAGHRVRRRAGLPGGLTRREAEVLVLLARGLTNPEIAGELTVARKTVSSHLERIYAKLAVTTRTEAALFAMRHGLVPAPVPTGDA
jgi:HD-GYP domain-containing protein (c-di-GMP phosphodiesterase class II)